jgi:hypothetical protein
LADEKDERPLWVLVWGGGNTVAQAIWKVQQERTPEQLKALLRKLRVYTITDQDRPQKGESYEFSSHHWLHKEFEKELFFIWDESAWGFQNVRSLVRLVLAATSPSPCRVNPYFAGPLFRRTGGYLFSTLLNLCPPGSTTTNAVRSSASE